jgi:hypothetical protein
VPGRRKPQPIGPPTRQALAEELDRVRKHLGMLGYDTRLHSDHTIRGVHVILPSITVELAAGFGMTASTGYVASPATQHDRRGYLELLNRINRNAITVRAYADEDASLIIASFFTGKYRRPEFDRFVQVFNGEVNRIEC